MEGTTPIEIDWERDMRGPIEEALDGLQNGEVLGGRVAAQDSEGSVASTYVVNIQNQSYTMGFGKSAQGAALDEFLKPSGL